VLRSDVESHRVHRAFARHDEPRVDAGAAHRGKEIAVHALLARALAERSRRGAGLRRGGGRALRRGRGDGDDERGGGEDRHRRGTLAATIFPRFPLP
jgi:hypothetical protein